MNQKFVTRIVPRRRQRHCRFPFALLAAICAAALPLTLTLSGCGAIDHGCSASVEPALIVLVTDAATGEPAAANATVVVTDGSFTETLEAGLSDIDANGNTVPTGFSGARERAGNYTVRVTEPGYTTVERTNVRVTKNDCHVNTQRFTIALTRE